jgi:hypothetical protein
MTEIETYQVPRNTVATTAPQQTSGELDSWVTVMSDVIRLASYIAETDFVPDAMRGKPAAVAAAMLAGREAGIGPMTALQNYDVIKGRPAQRPLLMRALVLSRGHEMSYVETNDSRCVVKGRRRGEEEWTTVSFTADQARKASINLGGYPEDKLVARATARLCRRKFSDVIVGMPYSSDELEDGDAEGLSSGVDADAPTAPAEAPKQRTAQRKQRQAKPAEPAPVVEGEVRQPETPPEPTGPPLPGEPGYDEPVAPAVEYATKAQLTKLHTLFSVHGIDDRDEKIDICARIVNEPLDSSKGMTRQQISVVIDTLTRVEQSGQPFAEYLVELIRATSQAVEDAQAAAEQQAADEYDGGA